MLFWGNLESLVRTLSQQHRLVIPMTNPTAFPVIRGRVVHMDGDGLFCLNDIWRAAGFSKSQTPAHWRALDTVSRLTMAVVEKITGKSGGWTKAEMRMAIHSKGAAGTYADSRLALSYAEYLNPKLALEVKEVFLRYKAGDAVLADEILERSTPEDNEWAGQRALARAGRKPFTDTLQRHGVRLPSEYAKCTNAVYIGLFRKTARELKAAKQVTSHLRDAMDGVELTFVAAGEALARERIEQTNCSNAVACEVATLRSTSFLRDAIEAERRDRVGAQQVLKLTG